MQPPLRLNLKMQIGHYLNMYTLSSNEKCFDNFKQKKLKVCRCCCNGLVINRMNYTCASKGHLMIPQLNMKIIVKQGCNTNQINRVRITNW